MSLSVAGVGFTLLQVNCAGSPVNADGDEIED